MFGFLNVYKPRGLTSHDVVSALRKITKIKQIGHTGTLDPFAEGVLPIAIGKATKLIEYLKEEKVYLAEMTFGESTTTFDIEGDVVSKSDIKVTSEALSEALLEQKGEILQMPPIYSAIKVDGKKLYEYAREGKTVEIEPRKVFIEKLEIKNFDEKNQKAEVLIKCSRGTYIRSIAQDVGKSLGSGAFLSKLIRTQSGKFIIDNTVKLDDLKSIQDVELNLLNPIELLDVPQKELNEEEHQKVVFGQPLKNTDGFKDAENILLIYNSQISAIAVVKENSICAKKVFA